MVIISLEDTEIPGPFKEICVDYNSAVEGDTLEDLSVEEKAAILNGKFKELLDSWKKLIAGETDFQRAYLEG